MSIDKETLEYDNNHGEINGTIDITINVNDVILYLSATFNNHNKEEDIRIIEALHKSNDLVNVFNDPDIWAGDEAEIFEAIEELETKEEPCHEGYGYNGSDVK